MAKRKSEEIKENLYSAEALVHIKYDKENYKPGDEFEVRESDVEELMENGYATVDENPIKVVTNTDDGKGDEPPVNPDDGEGQRNGE